jgi:hypothetical protein
MCRNIRTLFNFEPPVTDEEIQVASLQFIKKISGFNGPSKANKAVFFSAVDEVARISGQLLASLESTAPPKNRQERLLKRGPVPLKGSAGEFGIEDPRPMSNDDSERCVRSWTPSTEPSRGASSPP